RSLLYHAPRPTPIPSFVHNDTTPPATYPLSLHDALPISAELDRPPRAGCLPEGELPVLAGSGDDDDTVARDVLDPPGARTEQDEDRKSTRLNSSHEWISYAVFCLKKKKNRWNSGYQIDFQ